MNRTKKLLTKYSVALAIGFGMALISLSLGGYSADSSTVDKYRMLCNAFTTPAILLIMVGCLVSISTTGLFDMLSYAVSRAARAFIPGGRRGGEDFVAYKERKEKSRFKDFSFIIFTGLFFLTVAIVFLILFYRVY